MIGRALSALLLAILGYIAAGLVGGAIPVNRGWRPATDGITIFVESNGVHTDLILPKVAGGVDLRPLAPPGDLRDPRYAAYDHLAIGWGEKAFFLQTPHWRDVRPSTVLHAAIGSGQTLMHVEHLPRPAPADGARAIVLTPAEYRRLAAFIVASFRPGGARYPGYDSHDAFYDATGRYDAIRTCNTWTGRALRQAGVRIGAWTPFPITVTGWFTARPDGRSD